MNETKISENYEIENLLRDLLNNALKEMMAVVGAECGSLFLFDFESKEMILDAFHNSASLSLKGLRQRIGEGISGKVASMRTPVLVKNIDEDARFKRNGFNHYRTKSFISIPLSGTKGAWGLINLTDKSSGDSFSEEDLKSALAIARYACQVADNLNDHVELKNKYASVGKLAAGIVHEVNNPLDGIIRYTNLLLEQVKDNSIVREYLLEVNNGLNRIANITKSLLQFSHQVNASAPKIKKYADLHSLIDESINLFGERINRNIRIHKKYRVQPPHILNLGLEHVFINLIKNALDAMPEGGTLEITTDLADAAVKISFKDSGLGIPSEIRERIFEAFFTTKSIDKGTGLGLSVCQEIVHKYQGNILVESSPGKGSTFTVFLPQKYLENA